MQKQVDFHHYDFRRYVSKRRWNSIYHQIDEITALNPGSVLEVGPGSGILRVILKEILHYRYESIDIDGELKPDYIGSILEMPFSDNQYDVAACFQVMEHLPYEHFEKALSELFRIAREAIIISLPDAERTIRWHIHKIFQYKLMSLPICGRKKNKFDGEHYWEINRQGYELRKIIRKIEETAEKNNYKIEKHYRVWEMPYHHFFVLRRSPNVNFPGL